MEAVQQHIKNLYSKDKYLQSESYRILMKLTDKPVDFAYDIWDDLLNILKKGNNTGRSIAAQLLCNLAQSDKQKRLDKDLPKLFEATKDEKFVTARHTLLSLWKIGIVNEHLLKRVLLGLETRFHECINEKNCTLLRYDICCVFRKMFDILLNENIHKISLKLIETEEDLKYKKKYMTVWKGSKKVNVMDC
jgi:HEAT repeat protein